MNEQELRSLVREAVERHLGRPGSGSHTAAYERGVLTDRRAGLQTGPPPPSHHHPSHNLLRIAAGGEVDDGMCVIEPAVRCNHCGFCQSLGH